MSLEVDPRWYDGFFEREWLDLVALERDDERTGAEVDWVVEKLGVEPGARVLDLACGHGRHSLELARRGYRVTGVDLSPRSLELAREAAAAEGIEVRFVHSDMRELAFEAEFEAAINLFSSFGYLESDDEDRAVLERVARALRTGGGFLIETVSPLGLAARYQARRWEQVANGVVMLDDREWDLVEGRNRALWTFVRPDGSRSELRHVFRTYAPWELARLLRDAGLEIAGCWSAWEDEPLAHDSWRMAFLARK
jgi:SAM-dependent methyltransferase